MSARIVLVTAGSFGDLFPTLGLALGLAARGHRPVVATSPCYRALVEAERLPFHPVRPDLDPSDPGLLARVMDPIHGPAVVIRELVVPALRQSYDDLEPALPGADLVVSHPITFAAPLAAEVHGVPWISTALAPLSFFSVHDFPVLPASAAVARFTRLGPWAARPARALARASTRSWVRPVVALRRALGLPRVGHPLFEGQFSPRGTLALFSRVLGRPQPDWPPRTHQTGFVFYSRHGAAPEALRAFLDAGDPPIVFTLGSSAVGAAGAFYDESVEAATAVGRRAVLLVGRYAANQSRRPLPREVLAVDYAPHDEVFPRACAIVHHGGVGTTGQALRAGRPMLVVPHSHDQPDNGQRAERLGIARVIDARRYTARRAADALRALVNDRRHAERAAEIGRVVCAEDGVARACEAIEVVLGQAARSASAL